MIIFHGHSKKVNCITYRPPGRNKKMIMLHENSDPKYLYFALVEVTRRLTQLHQESVVNK